MNSPQNGLEFLEKLRERNGKQVQNINSFFQFLETKARKQGIPIRGQFELTPLCNFSCKMCYVHLDAEQMTDKKVLSVESWKALMKQAVDSGMIRASLTGGECLAYPGFDELFLYLQNMGCDIAVLTNGYLLTEDKIEFFKNHRPSLIQVTLYGSNEDVYEYVTGKKAFSTVIENIKKAIDAELPIRISVTPNRYLGNDVLETLRIAKKITKNVVVNRVIFAPRPETGRSEQQDDIDEDLYVSIYRLLNEINGRETIEIDEDKLPVPGGPYHECTECGVMCGGGRSSFIIDWQGTMMPCTLFDSNKAYPLQDGFKEAWSTINRKANSWVRVPECKDCPYVKVCYNCAAVMLQYAEPGKQPIELCRKTKYYVQRGVLHIPECTE